MVERDRGVERRSIDIKALQERDPLSWTSLYSEVSPQLSVYAKSCAAKFGLRNDWEDSVQYAWEHLFDRIDKLPSTQEEGWCLAYLSRAITNRFLDINKNSYTKNIILTDENPKVISLQRVEDEVIDRQDLVEVLRAVATLPEPQKRVISLTVVGESDDAISSELEMNRSAVKVNRFRARKKLEAVLSK